MPTKQHTVRIEDSLYDFIAMRAIAAGRSMNKEIETILKDARNRHLASEAAVIATLPDSDGQ